MKYNLGCKVTLFLLVIVCSVLCENKYSESANEKKKKDDVDFRTLQKPFRMNKLNLLWTKAQQVNNSLAPSYPTVLYDRPILGAAYS